jgi:recombinational DNA repair ATPase RecF
MKKEERTVAKLPHQISEDKLVAELGANVQGSVPLLVLDGDVHVHLDAQKKEDRFEVGCAHRDVQQVLATAIRLDGGVWQSATDGLGGLIHNCCI